MLFKEQHQVDAYYKATWTNAIEIQDENGEQQHLGVGEKIVFGIKAKWNDATYTIKKVLTAEDEVDGVYPITLTPEDMSITPGRYYYDVGVQYPDGAFIKIIPMSAFIINKSITHKEVS